MGGALLDEIIHGMSLVGVGCGSVRSRGCTVCRSVGRTGGAYCMYRTVSMSF